MAHLDEPGRRLLAMRFSWRTWTNQGSSNSGLSIFRLRAPETRPRRSRANEGGVDLASQSHDPASGSDDLDAQRGVLRVRERKGGHSRYALLSKSLLRALRAYYRKTRPPGPLLFPGQHDTSRPITREAIHWGLSQAVIAVKLSKRLSPHSLRHSFATAMLESGTDLGTVQLRRHTTRRGHHRR